MGLDMYLYRRVRKFRRDDGTMSSDYSDLKFDKYDRSNAVVITECAAYWLKANMVHKWFVDNVQDGKDDCGEYHVSKEQILELRDLCMGVVKALDGQEIRVPKRLVKEFTENCSGNGATCGQMVVVVDSDNLDGINLSGYHVLTEAQKNLVRKILPTQNGFFFGNTKYNGCYLMKVVNTIKKIDVLLEEDKDRKDVKYVYRASW